MNASLGVLTMKPHMNLYALKMTHSALGQKVKVTCSYGKKSFANK